MCRRDVDRVVSIYTYLRPVLKIPYKLHNILNISYNDIREVIQNCVQLTSDKIKNSDQRKHCRDVLLAYLFR